MLALPRSADASKGCRSTIDGESAGRPEAHETLAIPRIQICRQVRGFDDIVPLDARRLRRGQPILIYATLEKMDETLLEAAADLGCRRWRAFWRVTFPLSASGVLAGALLCFIPIVGEFVIPDLLGGSETQMIGQTLWTEFFANKDWPVASAIAVVLLVLLVVPLVIYQHLQTRALEGGR